MLSFKTMDKKTGLKKIERVIRCILTNDIVPDSTQVDENSGIPRRHIGDRRSQAWWEPTWIGKKHQRFEPCEWDFSHSSGPKQCYLSELGLDRHRSAGKIVYFKDVTFQTCDFQGKFSDENNIKFEDCTFDHCDFAYSHWQNVVFKKCNFIGCSFALTEFSDCEFSDCIWERIGIQGTNTLLNRTHISNPEKFINAAVSYTEDRKNPTKQQRDHQAYRLDRSKAKLLRKILNCHLHVGDNSSYYEAARLHDTYQIKQELSEKIYKFKHLGSYLNSLKVPLLFLELILLKIIGIINDWGNSTLRPFIFLAIITIFFSSVYYVTSGDFQYSTLKAFNISMIAGYTLNHGSKLWSLPIIEAIQVALSAMTYSVFFSTIISRHSRSR